MDTSFQFDNRQLGILGRNGIAAFVQRPPPGRIGWVYANQVSLHEWRPTKSVFRCLHIEVTWDSFERVYVEKFQFQPEWDGLMVTRCQWFLTEKLEDVEQYFAHFIDEPAFARWPAEVMLPMDLPGDRDEDLVDPFFSVPRQLHWQKQAGMWLKKIGSIQQIGSAPGRVTGRLLAVGLRDLLMVNARGEFRMPFPNTPDPYRYWLEYQEFSWWIKEACETVWDYQNEYWVVLKN